MQNPRMLMDHTSTIDQYVRGAKNEDFLNSAFYLQQLILPSSTGENTIIMNDLSVLLSYKKEFEALVVSETLSEAEYMKYRFNPKVLSYDLYGTTEMWPVILDLNEIKSALDFNFRVVKLYNTSIFERLNRVMSLEKENIDYNRASLNGEA